MKIFARTTISIITLVFVWTAVVFSVYTVRVAAQDEAGMVSYARCEGTGGFVPLECFKGSEKLADVYASPGLSVFLNKLFLGALSLGAVLAVLRLAWAGFQYMASDLWANKQHAKDIIQETLLGLFILLGISLILNQINPDILKLNVGISKLPAAPSAVDAGTAAGQTMQQRYADDTATSPTDYTRSVSQTPIPGYYCYQSTTGSGLYSCLTNQANCNQLAQSENATCTLISNAPWCYTQYPSLSEICYDSLAACNQAGLGSSCSQKN